MASDPCVRLREFLDQFPLGFPKTPSEVEMEILRRLFTEEEAILAANLAPFPEETGRIAARLGNALFEAVVDAEICVSCEACLERCPVGAIVSVDPIRVDRDKCLGCGLCAEVCPSGAIALHLREDREEPFDRVFDMGLEILRRKRGRGH